MSTVWRLIAAAAAVGTLSGCASSPVNRAEAEDKYGRVLKEVSDATATALGITWRQKSEPAVQEGEDGCVWFSATLTADVDLGRENRWPEAMNATNAAATDDGFDPAEMQDIPGGHTGFEATDGTATLSMDAKRTTELRLAVPVDEGC